jgi:hypothetical protein
MLVIWCTYDITCNSKHKQKRPQFLPIVSAASIEKIIKQCNMWNLPSFWNLCTLLCMPLLATSDPPWGEAGLLSAKFHRSVKITMLARPNIEYYRTEKIQNSVTCNGFAWLPCNTKVIIIMNKYCWTANTGFLSMLMSACMLNNSCQL